MRVAIQGTHGSFSEAAARRRWPGPGDAALPRGQGRGRRGARGPGRGRVPADRELAHRLGHDHLRSPGGGLRRRHAPADPRDPLPGAPHAHGRARRDARRASSGSSRTRSPWASAAIWLARAPSRRRAGERLGHRRQRRDRGPGGESGARRDRRAARRRLARARRRWPSGSRTIPPTRPASSPSPAPTRPRCPAAPPGRSPLQDLGHRADRSQAGHAGADPPGVRRAGREPDGAAVATRAVGAVDLPLLRGRGRLGRPIRGVAEALEEVEALAARVVVLGSYEAWIEGSRLSAPPPTPAHHTQKPDIPLVDRRRDARGHAGGGRATSSSAARSRC